MGWEGYAFALFVFILVAALILLIIRGVRQNSTARDDALDKRHEQVMKMYLQVEEEVEAFEAYIEDARRQFEDFNYTTAGKETKTIATETAQSPLDGGDIIGPAMAKNNDRQAQDGDTKRELILPLFEQGYTAYQIAERLGISNGEVAFYANLLGKQVLEEDDKHGIIQ